MKYFKFVVVLVCLAIATNSFASFLTSSVTDNQNGTWTYNYALTVADGEAATGLYIAACCDCVQDPVYDISELTGWTLAVESVPLASAGGAGMLIGPYVPTGQIATSSGPASCAIHLSGDQLDDPGVYNFSLTATCGPVTGDWKMFCTSSFADWSKGVNLGEGPVYVPCPEPITLVMLGLGGLLVRRRAI